MDNNSINKHRIAEFARMLKILSEPNRLRILYSMGLECTPVSAIIAKTGLSQTNVSFHLRALREAGLVKGERNGPFVFYCLYDTALLDLLSELDGWLENQPQMKENELAQAEG